MSCHKKKEKKKNRAVKMFGKLLTISLLLISPVAAQFGVAGGRKKAATFQELNEQAKQAQAAGGMPNLGDMDLAGLEEMMKGLDPEALKEMADLGPQFEEVMKILGEMSPEELQKQMQEAMKMMASDDVMESMLSNQAEILASLEAQGQIDAAELAKFKTDPEYFQQKMKEGIDQMKDLFDDPEMLKMATESMQGLSDLYNNPDQMVKMMENLFEDFNDDGKIEEVRQMLLTNPNLGHDSLTGMFDTEEMKEILSDPVKWRESVKEGQGILAGGAAKGAGGARVGEL